MSGGHLVIPAYRERARWPEFGESLLAEADRRAGEWTLQLVDDGSGVAEVAALEAWVEQARRGRDRVRPLIARPVNGGKGAAVYSGWDAANPGVEWLGFCDADGSVSAEEIFRIADGLGHGGEGPDLVACSRVGAGARREGGAGGADGLEPDVCGGGARGRRRRDGRHAMRGEICAGGNLPGGPSEAEGEAFRL